MASDPPIGPRSAQTASHSLDKDHTFTLKFNSGNALFAESRTPEAIEMLSQAMRLNPNDEDVQYELALAWVQKGKTEDAKHHYQEAK
jgi:Flp pilus assembly protein TadD